MDPREQLLYAIDLPDTEQELMITDRTGEEIGEREGQEVFSPQPSGPRPCCERRKRFQSRQADRESSQRGGLRRSRCGS